MDEPLLVEVCRGSLVESIHHVHAAVCDAEGALLHSRGNPEWVTYLRSSAKPLQALVLTASGAAEAFGLADAEIAVACASHAAEEFHLDAVRSMLAKAGLDESALRCGPHRPGWLPAADALVRAGEEPRAIHSNCSGKHAGMLLAARHLGAPIESYLSPDHPVQQEILAVASLLSGVPVEAIPVGVDGCGAPAYALPLRGSAAAFARVAAGRTGRPEVDAGAAAIVRAMMAHPEMVSGTGRFDTVLMQAAAGDLFCKSGAEGYYCAGIPGRGIGVALKVADGNGRAIPPAALHVLSLLHALPDPLPEELRSRARPVERNTAGQIVGEIRMAGSEA